MFFKSIPTSRVTPSPKRRLDAATYIGSLSDASIQAMRKLKYLEGILLVYLFDWCRESSELVKDRMCIVRRVRSMTRAVGVLRCVDEPENGSTRRGHGGPNGETKKLRFFGCETLIIRLGILGDNCRVLANEGQCRLPREGQLRTSRD
jgi:hypothetical protein